MHTKLTLRMDEELIRTAKAEAARRGKSVSQMVEEFFDSLAGKLRSRKDLPPVTASLVGALRRSGASVEIYRKHLREKYL